MTTKETIAENLRALRKINKWSMRHVAGLVFVSPAAYQKYEEKKSEPGIGTLKRLADLYGLTIDELITTNSIQCPVNR